MSQETRLPERRLNPPPEPRRIRCLDCGGKGVMCLTPRGHYWKPGTCGKFLLDPPCEDCPLESVDCPECGGDGTVPEGW
jgi:hypothetical protein